MGQYRIGSNKTRYIVYNVLTNERMHKCEFIDKLKFAKRIAAQYRRARVPIYIVKVVTQEFRTDY